MRRFIAFLGLLTLSAVGCHHVCGKCDCGPSTGEAALYAPMQGYPTPTTTQAETIGVPKGLPKN
jgi:hypothetical protein